MTRHPIHLAHKKTRNRTLQRRFPNATIFDLTNRARDPWRRFCPFYPHGDLPVPFSPGVTACSLEGVWEGLKVFDNDDIDRSCFAVNAMKGLRRRTDDHFVGGKRRGRLKGHRRGVHGTDLLDYRQARFEIFLPLYHHILKTRLSDPLHQMRLARQGGPLVFQDMSINADYENFHQSLSHAALVRAILDDAWPVIPTDLYRYGASALPSEARSEP